MKITYKNFFIVTFLFITIVVSSFFLVKNFMTGHKHNYNVSVKMQSGHTIDTTLVFNGSKYDELILLNGCLMRNHKQVGIICGVQSFEIKN
jgi:hypothetical protein